MNEEREGKGTVDKGNHGEFERRGQSQSKQELQNENLRYDSTSGLCFCFLFAPPTMAGKRKREKTRGLNQRVWVSGEGRLFV